MFAHRDMGVQVRVAGAGLAVVERRGDQTGRVDLGDAGVTGASERGMLLDPRERLADRLVMGVFDLQRTSVRPAPTAARPTSPA